MLQTYGYEYLNSLVLIFDTKDLFESQDSDLEHGCNYKVKDEGGKLV